MTTADKVNLAAAIIAAIGAVIAASFEIKRWMSEKLVLEVTWRTKVPGDEVEKLGVHRGLMMPNLPRWVSGPYGIPMGYKEPDFPCKSGYLIVTLTKRSKNPLQLRGIFLEMTTPDGVKIHSLPHCAFAALGLNEPNHFFAPHDKIDLTNAAICIETDRKTIRKQLDANN